MAIFGAPKYAHNQKRATKFAQINHLQQGCFFFWGGGSTVLPTQSGRTLGQISSPNLRSDLLML